VKVSWSQVRALGSEEGKVKTSGLFMNKAEETFKRFGWIFCCAEFYIWKAAL
jgi:hypothetical protein